MKVILHTPDGPREIEASTIAARARREAGGPGGMVAGNFIALHLAAQTIDALLAEIAVLQNKDGPPPILLT